MLVISVSRTASSQPLSCMPWTASCTSLLPMPRLRMLWWTASIAMYPRIAPVVRCGSCLQTMQPTIRSSRAGPSSSAGLAGTTAR